MATAYKDKVQPPVHLILSADEARELKDYVRNWMSDSQIEPEECALMRNEVFSALHDAGVK